MSASRCGLPIWPASQLEPPPSTLTAPEYPAADYRLAREALCGQGRSGSWLAIRIAPFWLKHPLYRWTPGGFGYYRKLRRYADPAYVHERDKHPVRRKHFGAEGLKPPDAEGLIHRDYDSYEEYVQHQRQKLDEILRIGHGFSNAAVAEARSRFYRRFRHLIRLVLRDAIILCLAGTVRGEPVAPPRGRARSRPRALQAHPPPPPLDD